MQSRVKKLIDRLAKRGIEAYYAPDRAEAVRLVGQLVPAGAAVGIGGSQTVKELALERMLKDRQCRVYWHWHASGEQERAELRLKAMTAQYYLCSVNAVTEDGRLVSTDGIGNRVSSMVFGPGASIIVVGVNKIVPGLEEARERIKNVACPRNARRLKRKTPCARDGSCSECGPPERLCNVTTIIEGRPESIEMHVVVVGEALGY